MENWSVLYMGIHEDTLPVLAILGVILSMTGVNLFIIRDPMRAISAVPLSLVHGGISNRLSSIQVNLYDENKKIAVSLEIGDYWGGEQKQRLRARYYHEDGSYKDLHSAYTNGDYSGVAQIRYDPLQGIMANVPGKSEKMLFLYDQVNGERLIKYVAIQRATGTAIWTNMMRGLTTSG
jgi:hypothetical protein